MQPRLAPNRRPIEGVGVFGLEQAAQYLAISRNTVREMCRDGQIEAWKTPGGHWRISRQACDRWVSIQEARARAIRAGEEHR